MAVQKNTQSHNIQHDVFIKAEPLAVYKAVSNPSDLENWWPLRCSGEARKGAEYNFFFEEPYDWYAQVMNADPGKHFHLSMTKSDPDWDPTSFGFDLTPENGQTRLQFWHRDWPEANGHFRHSSYCWAILLRGLKDYVESGKIIPFAERS